MRKLYFLAFLIGFGLTFGGGLNAKSSSEEQTEMAAKVERLNHLRTEGFRALDTHNYRKAEEIFRRALELGVEEWLNQVECNELLLCLIRSEVYTKQYRQAEAHFSRLIEEHMTAPLKYHRQVLLAHVRFGQGKDQMAMKLLNELKKNLPLKEWELSDQKFYLKVKAQAGGYYENLFTQAERCYEGGLYSETIPLYQEILEAIAENIYEQEKDSKLVFQLRLRLAFSEFKLKNYAKSKEMLSETKRLFPVYFDPESFLQLIACAQELKQYDEALNLCQEFFTFKFSPKNQEAVRYQMACIYFQQNEIQKAKKLFQGIIQTSKDERNIILSRFHLAKILLAEKDYLQVEEVLHPDHFRFDKEDPKRYEWAYLRAEALYHRKQYEMAVAGFNEALQVSPEQEEWYVDALYGQGFCYLKLAEDHLSQIHSKEDFLKKAEGCFYKLAQLQSVDRPHLALARTYLMQQYYLKDEQSISKIHALLKSYKFQSLESKLEAGFILADMTQDMETRGQIYQALTGDYYKSAQNYGKAWYYRAIYCMQLYQGNSEESNLLDAITFFKESVPLLTTSYSQQAQLAVKNIAECYLYFFDETYLLEGLSFLESYLSGPISSYLQNQAELICYQAELSLKLMNFNQKLYLSKGLSVLKEGEKISLSEQTLAKMDYLKGRLYFQAKDYTEAEKVFSHLIATYPKASHIQESYFWLAESNDLAGQDPALSKEYRQKVYEGGSSSPLAAEAYFLTYSFAEYLEGNHEAIEHLKQLEKNFPNSPYVVASYYLQGVYQKQVHESEDGRVLKQKNLSEAIRLFSLVRDSFEQCTQRKAISESNLHYFASIYYRSILAQAQCYLEKADECNGAKRHVCFEKALENFELIFEDFKSQNHPYVCVILKNEPYAKVFEEAEFGRALTYAKDGNIDQAEEALGQMIEHFRELKIEEGHYLSRAWYELAMIAMAKGEFQEALEYFNHAEQSLSSLALNADHKIDLGIQQSLCYRYLNQLDMAMLTLSKVINEGVISNLRVKAMVLRSEVYELQGRRDLAQKQLEAAAKKGGEWAKVAQEKLIKEYGFN